MGSNPSSQAPSQAKQEQEPTPKSEPQQTTNATTVEVKEAAPKDDNLLLQDGQIVLLESATSPGNYLGATDIENTLAPTKLSTDKGPASQWKARLLSETEPRHEKTFASHGTAGQQFVYFTNIASGHNMHVAAEQTEDGSGLTTQVGKCKCNGCHFATKKTNDNTISIESVRASGLYVATKDNGEVIITSLLSDQANFRIVPVVEQPSDSVSEPQQDNSASDAQQDNNASDTQQDNGDAGETPESNSTTN